MPPSVQLSPGMTGDDVKKLQDYLVSKGLLTEAQKSTGYGTYGPATTAAVLQLQKNLGVDYSSAPGTYGPRTLAAVGAPGVQTPSLLNTPVDFSGSSPQNIDFSKIGFGGVAMPPTMIPGTPASGTGGTGTGTGGTTGTSGTGGTTGTTGTSGTAGTPSTDTAAMQKAILSAVADIAANAAAIGKPTVSFAEALSLAAKDPNIVAKYSDALKLDSQAFQQSLMQLQQATDTNQRLQQTKFENERRQLADASAAAGQAYSGFRGRAQKELAASENGIVQSSRAQTQKSLQDLTTAFESKYGSAATPPATATFLDPSASADVGISGLAAPGGGGTSTLAGQMAGGITGSEPINKAADINKSALNSYGVAQFPQV